MSRSTAEIVREYGPFPDADQVNGVTYDGHNVWFGAGDKRGGQFENIAACASGL